MSLRPRLEDASLDLLFRKARSQNDWQPDPVPEALLRELHGLWRCGPTSTNGCPGRVIFVTSNEGREKLRPCLAPGNVQKTMSAPVTAILAYDPEFWQQLPRLFPHKDMTGRYRDDAAMAQETAFRNATLQAAYLIMAARALGLDCGPLSGFDAAGVEAAFLDGTGWRANMLVNLGVGQPTGLYPPLPRPEFDEVCRIL